MKIKVAVLEDDAAFRDDILVPELAERGFAVEGFGGSAELYQRMLAVPFELLVLDLRLDDENGLDVARYLRSISGIGIVALSGRASPEERVQGLMEAVDIWLGKPVDIELLAASLHSLSRRIRSADALTRKVPGAAAWRLSPGNWRLIAPDDRSLPLNLLERHLLMRLLATPSEVVTHSELIEALEPISGSIDRHRLEIVIHRLRRKVEHQLGQALPLRSIRGSGYVVVPTV